MSNIITSLDNNVKFPVVLSLPATLNEGTIISYLDALYIGDSNDLPIAVSTTDVATAINGATEKTTPVDSDLFGIVDSAASNVLKKLSWASLKATLNSIFGALDANMSVTNISDTLSLVIGEGKFRLAVFNGTGTGIGRELYTEDANGIVPACGYYEYVAKLSQTGTNAPTATVIKNTLGSAVFARVGAGDYTCTFTGLLTLNKTFISISNNSNQAIGNFGDIMISENSIDSFSLEVTNDSGVPSDAIIGQDYPMILTIRVYL